MQTTLGHYSLGQIFSVYLSKKTQNSIEVSALKIDAYPHVSMDITINNHAKVHLEGIGTPSKLKMNYHLTGDSFRYNNFFVENRLEIFGNIKGSPSSLLVDGEGDLFNGKVAFNCLKLPAMFKNVTIDLKGVYSEKVLKFLHQKPLITGKANIKANFKKFSKYQKDGDAVIRMQQANMPSVSGRLPFALKSEIEFKDIEYFYKLGIKSKVGNLTVIDGYYHKRKHEANALYAIDLEELSPFEPLLKRRYKGGFKSEGSFYYKDGVNLIGKSDKFEGLFYYKYSKSRLELDLKGVSLEKLLHYFSYPVLLSAKVYGSLDYNRLDKILLIDTKLKETQFRKTKITDMILTTTGIDMLHDRYNNSSFAGVYKNNILESTLKIDNGSQHVYLTKTKVNTKKNSINSDFDVKLTGEELSGEIYGTLDDPSVSINMKKLLKYQLRKRLGSWLGGEKKETVKKELNSIKEDVSNTLNKVDVNSVKEKAKSFLKDFF